MYVSVAYIYFDFEVFYYNRRVPHIDMILQSFKYFSCFYAAVI